MRKILAITTVIGLITIAMINVQYYDLNADVQDITQLSSGAAEETLNFPDNSETRIINVTLPKNATVTKAIVNLTGYPILNVIDPTPLSVISNDVNDQDSFDPEMVMTLNETLHVVWVDDGPIIGNDNDNDIYYTHKPKDQSWNNIILISDASPNSNSIEPTMTTDMQNNTCVAWVDDSNYGGSGNDNDILLKNCTSGVWGTISVISDDLNNGDSLNPQIAADVQGNLHLVWADDGNLASSGNDYDIVYRKYNASSKSWEAPIIISDGNNDGASLNPSILHLDNYIHIAWEDNSNINQSGSDYDILYRYWNATAGSWSGTFVISDDTNDGESYNASISGNEDSELFICWQDDGNINNSGTDIDAVYKIWSPELGAWSTTNVLSTELNSNNALNPIINSGLFGNLHGIWYDNGNINNCGPDYDIIHKRFDGITNNFTAPLIISNDNNDGNSTNPKMLIRTGKMSEHFHNLWVDDGNIANSGLDRDIVYTSYSFNYSYPSNIKLDVGNNNSWDWSYNGEINTTMTIGDTVTNKWFSETLNSIITSNTNFDPPPELIVPLKFYSATPGYLQISDLKITYTLTPDPPTNLTLLYEKNDWHLIDNIPTFSWEFNDMDSQTQG
ncbi:MAG: hypothetical protein KAJ51_14215 [Thermoplasmata archaeon]|nr:hypothetical protein [Thermoplasmata archaeon]